ncbi:MAG: hypothetical protein LBC28_05795 [Oscillospiraceae bacterium]|jgi:hypothetical protein|nr:hypothetical protein [Oscillospiraceae bacterium]
MLGITVFGLVFIVVVICAVAALSGAGRGVIEIELPEPAGTAGEDAEQGGALPRPNAVEVSADNIQDVIASLRRPEAYTRDIMVESFWSGGNSVTNLSVSVTPGAAALRVLSGGAEKNIVTTPERTYIWYAGETSVFETASDGEYGAAADEYQMIPTYEDILRLPRGDIKEAGYVGGDGAELYVRYVSGTLGYETRCRVSIRLGLLTYAEIYDGETPIYRMTAGECRVGEPDARAFTLPDGRNAAG